MKFGILILAAGASSRLGEPKQLLKFKGKTLLRRAAETALATNAQQIVVVFGANAETFNQEIADLPVKIIVAADWASGMSASIKSGIEKLIEIEPELSVIVLLLCDQPFVTDQTVARLIKKYQETKKPIIVSEYNETVGVPALFARDMFDELLNLAGETGAKFLIKKQAASGLEKIAVPEAAFDVDTPADYKKLVSLT